MNEATVKYSSQAGKIEMSLQEHTDLIKIFKAIILMEEQRIQMIKEEEKTLKRAKKELEQEYVKRDDGK